MSNNKPERIEIYQRIKRKDWRVSKKYKTLTIQFQPYKGLNPECSKIFTQRED